MTRHSSPISGVACGPHGYIATAGYDNQVILWQHRKPTARAHHDHLVNQCSFSPDGRMLITASSDYTARLWSVPHLRLLAVMSGHEDDVEMAVFSPDGRMVATASRDCRVRVFDLGGRQLHVFEGHAADVISVVWDASGRELLSSSDDGTLRRWSLDSEGLVGVINMSGVETDTIAVGPNGTVYAGTDHGQIHIVSNDAHRVIDAHDAGIKRLALSPDGDRLVSASYDRTLRQWACCASDLVPLGRTQAPSEAWLRAVAFDEHGNIVVGTFGSSYAVYHPDRDKWSLEGVHQTGGINSVASVSGRVYTVGDAGIVRCDGQDITAIGSLCNFIAEWRGRIVAGGHLGCLFDARTGEVLLRHRSPLNCVAVLVTEELIVGTYTGEGLRLRMDAGTGKVRLHQSLKLHDQAIKGLAANGRHIFSVSAAGAAAYHDLATGELADCLPDAHRKIANGACALPDGGFATVSRDLSLRIWRDGSAREIETPHGHSIKCLALSTDGRWLGTGSYGGQVAFYDLRRECWSSLQQPTFSGISCLAAYDAPAGLLASSYDGRIYRVHAEATNRDLADA